jgi:hypothetical protein
VTALPTSIILKWANENPTLFCSWGINVNFKLMCWQLCWGIG